MNEEIGLKEILANLKKLPISELQIVQKWLTDVVYAKGVEDYLRAAQMGPLVEKLTEQLNPKNPDGSPITASSTLVNK